MKSCSSMLLWYTVTLKMDPKQYLLGIKADCDNV